MRTVLTPREDAHRAGIVTARYPGRDGEAVAAQLNDAGVIVVAAFRRDALLLHFFNDESDVDRVLATLSGIPDERAACDDEHRAGDDALPTSSV